MCWKWAMCCLSLALNRRATNEVPRIQAGATGALAEYAGNSNIQ